MNTHDRPALRAKRRKLKPVASKWTKAKPTPLAEILKVVELAKKYARPLT